jgi:carboxylesterase type B
MIAPFCLLIQMVLATRVSQSLTSVDTIYGPIHGLDFGTHRRFQGVPFASPPLGALRFKDPIPPTPWTTPLNCTYFDTGCAQRGHSLDVPKNTSEDCLYLEVWAPALNKYATPANVMIFLYGGDFKEGGEAASVCYSLLTGAQLQVRVLHFMTEPTWLRRPTRWW